MIASTNHMKLSSYPHFHIEFTVITRNQMQNMKALSRMAKKLRERLKFFLSRSKVTVKVTRSLALVPFERDWLAEYACQIWSLYLAGLKGHGPLESVSRRAQRSWSLLKSLPHTVTDKTKIRTPHPRIPFWVHEKLYCKQRRKIPKQIKWMHLGSNSCTGLIITRSIFWQPK